MKLLNFILIIFLLTFSTIQSFGTTWATAYPYVQQIDGQSVVVKSYSYAPYSGGPMIGITKVYSNNKLLYSIDRYYRERIFTSQDGQYLAVVRTSKSAYRSLFYSGIDFNQTVVEIFKNGLPFKTYTLKDVIDTTRLANNGYLFNWGYSIDFEMYEKLQSKCKICREVWGRNAIKTGNVKKISPDSWKKCKSACDSMELMKIELNVYKNSIFVQDNSLFVLTNQNTVVVLNFETMEVQQLPFEKIVPDKKTFNPPKLKRKYKKIKLPDKFDKPNMKDRRSFEKGIADFFKLTIPNNPDEKTFCVFINRLLLNKKGKCVDFYGAVYDERISKYSSEESINIEMTDKLKKWVKEQTFDTKLIPKGFEAYSFLCIVYLDEN